MTVDSEFVNIDVLWLLVAASMVFLMQAGFLCLEAGLTRPKNSINVAVKNLADFTLAGSLFWLFGFGIMFGTTHAGWFGFSDFMPELGLGNAWDQAFFFFQVVFCGTAVTIVSGAVAERVRFGGYLIIAIIISAIIYPLFGHWAWGGLLRDGSGWLAERGFVDFAGSTVVHSVGGWVGLIACIVIGARLGRFDENGKPKPSSSANLPIAMLGALLLWFGWFGFNGGSTLTLDATVPGIIANTLMAAIAGMLVSIVLSYSFYRYVHAGSLINGTIAGLVAVTAGCHALPTWGAMLVGAIGSALAMLFTWVLN